jgi:hypothetical protein
MPRAERSDADTDEEPGVVAVQITLLHHIIRDVAGGPTGIEFIADLMTGNDRGLPGRKGDAPGCQRVQEVVIDRVGMCPRGCYSQEAKQRDQQDKLGR